MVGAKRYLSVKIFSPILDTDVKTGNKNIKTQSMAKVRRVFFLSKLIPNPAANKINNMKDEINFRDKRLEDF